MHTLHQHHTPYPIGTTYYTTYHTHHTDKECIMLDSTIRAMANLPEETAIIEKVLTALSAVGNPIVAVDDTEERIKTPTREDALDAIYAVDYSTLYTKSGQFVTIILGNGEDVLSDFSSSLEDVLYPNGF